MITKVRFYHGDVPVFEVIDTDGSMWMPDKGDFVRFGPDESAWYVQDVVVVYGYGNNRIEADRLDISITRAHPAESPFPQITRAPVEMGVIPPLEPPEKDETRAET